jgi:hypothetical protein
MAGASTTWAAIENARLVPETSVWVPGEAESGV